jgi:hypothetical protein
MSKTTKNNTDHLFIHIISASIFKNYYMPVLADGTAKLISKNVIIWACNKNKGR